MLKEPGINDTFDTKLTTKSFKEQRRIEQSTTATQVITTAVEKNIRKLTSKDIRKSETCLSILFFFFFGGG